MDADKEFLSEFICCYEMHRCLWDVSSPEYMCKDKKHESYKELLECMQKFKKKCELADVKKKINTIRSSYRRELKKMKASESSGAGIENVYQPKVWWFDACHFLRKFEKPTEGVSTFTDDEPFDATDTTTQNEPPKKKPKRKDNEVMDLALSYLKEGSDEFDHLAKAWALKPRKMQPRQCKLAERLINDVLFQGDLEMLSMDSAITTRKTTYTAASSSTTRRTSTPYLTDIASSSRLSAQSYIDSMPTSPQDAYEQEPQLICVQQPQNTYVQPTQFTNLTQYINNFTE